MFGAYYYGFVDRADVKADMKIARLASNLDRNDFMFSNSLYALEYEIPASRSLVVVHSDSPPSPPMTLVSPADSAPVVDRRTESLGAHVSTDPSVEGIDQFGTNTFQIREWLKTDRVEANPQRGRRT
jgi:hypothetical protein